MEFNSVKTKFTTSDEYWEFELFQQNYFVIPLSFYQQYSGDLESEFLILTRVNDSWHSEQSRN